MFFPQSLSLNLARRYWALLQIKWEADIGITFVGLSLVSMKVMLLTCHVVELLICKRAIAAVYPFDQAIKVTEVFIQSLKTHEDEFQYDSLRPDFFPCVLVFYQNLLIVVMCFVIILVTLLCILVGL